MAVWGHMPPVKCKGKTPSGDLGPRETEDIVKICHFEPVLRSMHVIPISSMRNGRKAIRRQKSDRASNNASH